MRPLAFRAYPRGMKQLAMRRDDLEGLAQPRLPEGYRLRLADADDTDPLAALLALAFEDATWTADRVQKILLGSADVFATYVATDSEGRLVAVTSCQFREPSRTTGTLHWVGGDPDHRGRGLGKAVSLACLHRFAADGYSDCNLFTDDARLPAINTYLALGFRPEITDPSHPERWALIRERLGR
ncbi:GNAT family N-acetyltransferase [bacterium]|nr:MAG: GNAT family N-acetyltransferase [bacterium]